MSKTLKIKFKRNIIDFCGEKICEIKMVIN